LNEAAAGVTFVKVCRGRGIRETAFYRWKAKCDAKRLR
jgi:hypothetical protein